MGHIHIIYNHTHHTTIHTHAYWIPAYIDRQARMHAYIQTHIHAYGHAHTHIEPACHRAIHPYSHTHRHTYIESYRGIPTHTHTYRHTQTYNHPYMYIYTQ